MRKLLYEKSRPDPSVRRSEVDVLIPNWKRPLLLLLTVLSVRISLRSSQVNVSYIVIDQEPSYLTRKIIQLLPATKTKIIEEKSIGMGGAWSVLLEASTAEYILLLENDWWCDTRNSSWLDDAVRSLEVERTIGAVRLRRIGDVDDCGAGKLHHAPWTVKPLPDTVQRTKLSAKVEAFLCRPQNMSFSFNPTIFRRSIITRFAHLLYEDQTSSGWTRNSEDRVDPAWRGQEDFAVAILANGPFRHAGFYSRRNYFLRLPIYTLVTLSRWLRMLFRGDSWDR